MKTVRDLEVLRYDLAEQFRAEAEMLNLSVDVLGEGPIDAEVAFVGEGPGETEVRKGRPFIGGSGNLLFNAVSPYGLRRDNVYVTNVVKRQISLTRKGSERHAVLQDELDRWIGLVKWELEHLPNVRVIFLLGNMALEAFADRVGILKWRGSVLEALLPNGRNGHLVCSFNPAYPMRELKYEPIFNQDCKKLDMVLGGRFTSYKIDEIINPTYREARAFIRDLQRSPKPVAYDIETMNNEVACYGLSNDPHRAMCVNVRDSTKNRYTLSEEYEILNDLQKLCDSHRIIAQNGQFDSYCTQLKVWVTFSPWVDPLLAHHTLYPLLPHSLAFLTSQYTTHPFYKDDGDQWKEGGDIDTYWRYNCKDAAILNAITPPLLDDLRRKGDHEFFFNHVMRATPHTIDATVQGMRVDEEVRQLIIQQCKDDTEKLKEEFHRLVFELVGDPDYKPNPRSWQQLQELFFDRLRLEGKGKSTDEANRDIMLASAKTDPVAKEMLLALNRFISEDKFRGTFAESKVSDDGRFRWENRQFGVQNAPGRLSCAALLLGDGGNIQNQPNRARSMYVADPGCELGYADGSQAEARVVGWRANIPKWMEQFEKARKDGKYDAHRALASEMFKVPYDDVPKKDHDQDLRPTIRYIAKRCRHGLNYRMQVYKLAEVTGLSLREAAKAYRIYHATTPELKEWWDEEVSDFKRTKVKYNAFGRPFRVIQKLYDVYGHEDEKVFKSLIAFYPQSTVGDWIVRSWYMAEEDDAWPDRMYARVAIDVHDNLVSMSIPKYTKTCLKLFKKHFETPILIQDVYKNKPVPLIIPSEFKISIPTRWDPDAEKKDKEGNVTGYGDFVEDAKRGLHRWGNMKGIEL